MRKLYTIIIIIGIAIFGYWTVISLSDFSSKLFTVASDTLSSTSFSSTGNFAFKATPERADLIKEMIKINSDFIADSTLASNSNNINNIKKFYKLEKFFPNFNYYYTAKLKIQNIIFTELKTLYTNTSSLSDSELQTYFNNNTEYLEQKWGINDFSSFLGIVSLLKESNGKNIVSCELEDSYFYIDDLNLLNFRIILTLEDSYNIYLGAKIYIFESNEYQSAPLIRFLNTSGGQSYV